MSSSDLTWKIGLQDSNASNDHQVAMFYLIYQQV